MSALPPEQMREMRGIAVTPAGSIAERWQDLHNQAAQLAQLAQLSNEPFEGDLAAVPAMLGGATEWQRELAWQAIEDIDAMMQPGMVALRSITARGQDVNAPALALWREFHSARNVVVDLAKQGDNA